MLSRLSRALVISCVVIVAVAAVTTIYSKHQNCLAASGESLPTESFLQVAELLECLLPSSHDETGQTLPSGRYLDHPPQYFVPTPTVTLGKGLGGTLADLEVLLVQSVNVRLIDGEWRYNWIEGQQLVGANPSRTDGGIAPRKPLEDRPAMATTVPWPFGRPKNMVGFTFVTEASWSQGAVTQVPGMPSPASPQLGIAVLSMPIQVMNAEMFKSHQARHFYEIAGMCEERGDMAMARNCYEEATRVSPDSTYGMLASNRLAALTVASTQTAGHNGVEVQEEPPMKKELVPESSMDVGRMVESWRMLHLGENYRLAGDLDNAIRCFQDAYAICPASRYGKAAQDRMIEVERVRAEKRPQPDRRERHDGAEEQQLPTGRRNAYSDLELQQRGRAHELFVLAESSFAEGDLRMAYNLYQETHLAFPDCYYGMRAIERMQEIERRRVPLRKGG